MKYSGLEEITFEESLPPCGGSGLKFQCYTGIIDFLESPSMRREWIEISCSAMISALSSGLPPCGGSGLKFRTTADLVTLWKSPSMRREWIEINSINGDRKYNAGLPPCGGSGLKCIGQLYDVMTDTGLPPCGGSGLKSKIVQHFGVTTESPSMRREWIEITL